MISSLLVFFCIFTYLPYGDASSSTNSSTTPISRCDCYILEKIKAFQCLAGRPGYIIKTAYLNYIEDVLKTTFKYYSSNTKCVSSKFVNPNEDFTSATVMIYEVDSNDITTQKNITVYEKCGTTYDPGSKILRVHIWYKNGVTLVYVCKKDNTAPKGPASFFVKRAIGRENNLEDVAKAVKILDDMGESVPEDLSECGNTFV